jgi:hypothetical protein
MQEIRYTVTSRERAFYLVFAALVIGLGALYVSSGIPVGFPLFVALYLVNLLVTMRHHTVLTPQGITWRRLGTQHLDWHDIATIRRRKVGGAVGVELRLTDGSVKNLAVPRSSRMLRDPQFDAKLATIWNAWAGATGRGPYIPGPAAPEEWWTPEPDPALPPSGS